MTRTGAGKKVAAEDAGGTRGDEGEAAARRRKGGRREGRVGRAEGGAMMRTGGAGKKVAAEDAGGTRGDEGEGSGEEENGGMQRGSGREGRGGACARGCARGWEGRGDDENRGEGEEEGESVEGGVEELEAERRRVLQLRRSAGSREVARRSVERACVRARGRRTRVRRWREEREEQHLHPCFFCSPTNAMARTSATRRRVVVAVASCRLCRAAQQQIDVHVANGDRARALPRHQALPQAPAPERVAPSKPQASTPATASLANCIAAPPVPTTTYDAFSVGTISPAQFKSALRVKLGVAEDVSKRREAYDLCDARGQTHLWFFFVPTRQRYRIAFAAVPDATSVIASIGASCALVLSCAFARVFSPSSPASANRERKLCWYTQCLGACRIVYGDFAPVVYLQPFLETFVE
ncbi:hypothetical protein C8F04DRAFT_1196561 [Mycena alexandri]|uniref:Uncharacterized protein n=1 Tax=Mycena alexandri TaxID=1745969 RepID=A0AAD6S454_9AGAR|nr:hypothetical protein C8F04DRAFT_1196561 [Mycena alexandri]